MWFRQADKDQWSLQSLETIFVFTTRKLIVGMLLLEEPSYWLHTKHSGHVEELRSFWRSVCLRVWRVEEAIRSYLNPEPLTCPNFKVYFHWRCHSGLQSEVCMTNPSTPYHIISGRKMITKSNSDIDLIFSKSFDWQQESTARGRERGCSRQLPAHSQFPKHLNSSAPQMVTFATWLTEGSEKPAAGQGTEPRAVTSVFPKEAASFGLTDLHLFMTWQGDHGSLAKNDSTDQVEQELPRTSISGTCTTKNGRVGSRERGGLKGLGRRNYNSLEGKQGGKVSCNIRQDICKNNSQDWKPESQGLHTPSRD